MKHSGIWNLKHYFPHALKGKAREGVANIIDALRLSLTLALSPEGRGGKFWISACAGIT
jgi:hypothetical protein